MHDVCGILAYIFNRTVRLRSGPGDALERFLLSLPRRYSRKGIFHNSNRKAVYEKFEHNVEVHYSTEVAAQTNWKLFLGSDVHVTAHFDTKPQKAMNDRAFLKFLLMAYV